MLGANKKKKVSEFATPYTVGNAQIGRAHV